MTDLTQNLNRMVEQTQYCQNCHPEPGEGSTATGKIRHQSHSLRSRPVISAGGSIPSRARAVGATSRNEPPVRSETAPDPTATRGTGLVVCAVWTPPVAGSIIISQFPW